MTMIVKKKIFAFGNVLADMNKSDEAEKHYLCLLDHLSSNNSDIARCYHGLVASLMKKMIIIQILNDTKKSLYMRITTLKSDHPHLVPGYINIGCDCFNKSDYLQALESYNTAF
ncbi:unnamed protein product [Rotaria sp. Silwood2]|nr:unnamed protein product [Rotaria sp. Silwood2]CAF3003026.1 unnamed protein product [Rotaria sp. Silwood2]CAF3368553.1 unnamed protein product [Rotaria sp. Silwood2]CAF4185166.1 unnamed protein product [Rotaria sp. Silwood2]CAF4380413.1 unnamed protein product [Rotaria sp. Silwood2]